MAKNNQTKIGIIGCGAIGSGVAVFIDQQLSRQARVSTLCDTDHEAAKALKKKLRFRPEIVSIKEIAAKADLIIEAASAPAARVAIEQAVKFEKDLIILSMGALLDSTDLLKKAGKKNMTIYLPSGAIAGVDVLGALSMGHIEEITLTTSKPPKGLLEADYFKEKKINIAGLKKRRCLFEGDVKEAIKYFPKNVNVAVTLLMASGFSRVRVRIEADPFLRRNKHLIVVKAKEAAVRIEVENVPSVSNPKTSALTILSTQYLLKKLFSPLKIGS